MKRMANKLFKLVMLSTFLFTVLGLTLASCSSSNDSNVSEEEINLNDHTHDGWISLSQSDFDSTGEYADGSLDGGTTEDEMAYYYLNEDVNVDITITNYVALCLNGNTITGTGSTSVVIISSGAYFSLYDCSEDGSGTIKGGYASTGAGVHVSSEAIFNMYGGNISENTGTFRGAGVYLYNAVFNMYGGTICYNTATSYSGGVFVYYYSKFTMTGGSISNNTAAYGGGIFQYNNTEFTMTGGAISNNSATIGGGIVVQSSTFSLYDDGTIGDNTASTGNDIYIYYDGIFLMYGGYLSNDIYNGGGSYSLTGGYFKYDPSSYSVSDYYIVVDLSLIGSYLDENYIEGYDYAIYRRSATLYQVTEVEIAYGETYILDGTDETSTVVYTWNDGADDIVGFPTDIGENYVVTAHILDTITVDNITTNYYGSAVDFYVTITKGQAKITLNSASEAYDGEPASIDYTITVGELDVTDTATTAVTWYDENNELISAPTEIGTYKATIVVSGTDDYDGTSLHIEYTITYSAFSVGVVIAIVVSLIFVVGIIVFVIGLIYYKRAKLKKVKN